MRRKEFHPRKPLSPNNSDKKISSFVHCMLPLEKGVNYLVAKIAHHTAKGGYFIWGVLNWRGGSLCAGINKHRTQETRIIRPLKSTHATNKSFWKTIHKIRIFGGAFFFFRRLSQFRMPPLGVGSTRHAGWGRAPGLLLEAAGRPPPKAGVGMCRGWTPS